MCCIRLANNTGRKKSPKIAISAPPMFGRATIRLGIGPHSRVNLECRSETWCMWLAENTGRKKSPKIRHLGTIAQLCRVIFVSDIAMFVLKRDVKLQLTNCRVISLQPRHASTIGKNLLNSLQMSSQYANVGPLTAEIGLPVLDTPANFNWFHLLASLLQRCRSTEASQTLHNLWSSPGLAHYI